MNKIKFLIGLCFLFCYSVAQAHQPDLSSTMLVEQEDGKWILQVRASMTAFQYEVKVKHGEHAYDTPEKFQELVINHVKENISINFDQQDLVVLQNGFVKLGHETNVVFAVEGLPKMFNSLSVKNSSFKDISRNQSALIILKKGFEKEQFVLSNENNHKADLKVGDSKFILQSKSVNAAVSFSPNWIVAGSITLLMGIFLFWNRKRKGSYHVVTVKK